MEKVVGTVQAGGVIAGSANPEGRWERSGLPPGSYRLSIEDQDGSRWAVEEVEVAPGRPPVEIVLPLVEVRGRVRRGKEPLAATLWFGGRAGARRVRFDADEEGRFEGVLPEEGTWRVELVAEEAGLKLAVPPVEVKRRKGSRVAEVEVLLSDTTLAGEVVDEAGREVPEAALTVTSQGERMSTSVRCCDERGRFEVRGLPTGRAIVEAEARGGASGPVEVFLEEGRPSPWLRIVVRRRTEIAGLVLSASGPVPGAEILAWPDLGQAGLATIEGAVTGPDGAFHLRLPPGGEALNLVVFAPGHALRLLRLGSGLDQPLEIPVEPSGGTLILEMPEEGKGQPLLAHGGTFITPFVLQRWARLQGSAQGEGQRLVLPNLESGPYLLCAGAGASQRLRQGREPSAAECASGVLAPLGELTLRLPEGRPEAPGAG